MKLLLILSMFLITTTYGYSQTTYYSYDPNTGTSTKVGYSVPSSSSSYNSPYIPRVDLNLYKEVLQQKQAIYNERVSSIWQRMKDLLEYADGISDKDYYQKVFNQLNDFADQLSSHKYDFADDGVYNWVNKNIDIIRNNISKGIRSN